MRKKVLVVAYYFPPLGGAGVQRVLKFVKYLPDFGWDPVVLTVKDISYPARDQTLLTELPANIEITRAGSFDPFRLSFLLKRLTQKDGAGKVSAGKGRGSSLLRFVGNLAIPDPMNGWIPFAVCRGLRLIKRHKIDLIFSTSPPVSAHLAAHCLSRYTSKPLVLDFRDPWALPGRNYPTALHQKANELLERKILSHACATVTVNKFLAQDLGERFPRRHIATIPNGFDPTDFEMPVVSNNSKFEVTYLGTFNRWHDPRPFLGAASELVRENSAFAKDFTFTKIGLVLDWDWEALLAKYKLREYVTTIGYLPHLEGLGYMKKSQVLLVTTAGEKWAESIVAGKIYEYLASGKPILAVVSRNGAAGELLAKLGVGNIVSPDDKAGIKRELLKMFDDFKANKLGLSIPKVDLSQFERKAQTAQLAKLFDSCLR